MLTTAALGLVLYSSKPYHTPPPPTPWLTIREHVLHLLHLNYVTHLAGSLRHPTPKFNSCTLIFATFIFQIATLPRDREWHISKKATLPRAAYQPHANNNHNSNSNNNSNNNNDDDDDDDDDNDNDNKNKNKKKLRLQQQLQLH